MRAILMLHSIDSSGSAISLTAEQLRSLVRGVLNSGHAIMPLGALLDDPARQGVALTFDDGFASLAEIAAPLLSDEGACATLFLTTGYVGRDNHWPSQPASAPRLPLLDWRGVETLHAAGWQIEAHTQTHPDLRKLSVDQMTEELEAPRREIERRLGRPPRAFAYPYGLFDSRVVDAVRAAYDCAVTTQMAALPSHPVDPLLVPRLDAYYMRHPAVQRLPGGFGAPAFRALMALRAVARRWRHHPGEHA